MLNLLNIFYSLFKPIGSFIIASLFHNYVLKNSNQTVINIINIMIYKNIKYYIFHGVVILFVMWDHKQCTIFCALCLSLFIHITYINVHIYYTSTYNNYLKIWQSQTILNHTLVYKYKVKDDILNILYGDDEGQ